MGSAAIFFTISANAQCPTISCPGDISANNDASQCGAVINFTAPQGIDPCANQSITFTNCGATGRLGPTQAQVNAEYNGGPLDGQVTINTQGKQEWTVPITGTYTFEVAGARGGNADATYQGGLGALMQGDINLTAGDQLVIIVGHSGQDVVYAGGGGASAVSLNSNPIIVAGGGGGSNSVTNLSNGYDAVTGPNGVASFTAGGTGGNGSDGGYGQGGAGYLSNGQNIGLSGISVPQSLQGSAIGGEGFNSSYWGSFGGGGSGFGGGGGGGGYSGGSGGQYTCCTSVEAPGGGGGSFNSGTNQSNLAGVNTGNGYVTITWSGSAATTTQIAGLASGSTFPVGTTTNTFEATDGNGNTATCSFDIVVVDATAPVADVTSLTDVTDECSATPTAPLATDNCAGAITGTPDVTFPITTQGTTTVTWTYDDGNGNTSTQTQDIVITDITAPIADLAALSDVTDNCSVTSLTAPTATDNCGGTVTVTNDATFPITTQGTTTVTWTYDDGNGNTSTQTQDVIISGLNVDITVNEPTLTADNSEAGVTYQWIDCDNQNTAISGATSQSFTPDSNGNYAVIITQDGCEETSACEMISTVDINEHSITTFKLYPNPNNGQFTVESSEVVELYTIVDVNGRMVHNDSPKSTSFKIDLSNCESGIYYVQINEEIMKVIKK